MTSPKIESDHHMKCPGCGGWFDMRDLAQVLAHVHGEQIDIGERPERQLTMRLEQNRSA
jgi:hypothetical protein